MKVYYSKFKTAIAINKLIVRTIIACVISIGTSKEKHKIQIETSNKNIILK
jgi:hypothetical protein